MENNQTQDTIDTEAIEIKSLSLVDATIATAKKSFAELVKESSVDKKAKELKALLKKTEIKDIDDKDGYKKVKEISRDASKIRIALEKRRKELKADIILAGKNIDNLANEYQALINPVENDADAKLLVIDNAIEEARLKTEREAQEKLDARVLELKENGLHFDGLGSYVINDINVSIQFIQELPEEKYPDFLSKVKAQNEINIAEAKRKEEEAKAEQEKQEAIRLENERKQKELDEKQAELNAKLKAIEMAEKALEDKAKAQRELEEKQAKEAQEKADRELLAERAKPFEELGFTFNYSANKWAKSIGKFNWQFSKEDVLSNGFDFEVLKEEIGNAKKIETERLEKEEADRQAKAKADAEIAEQKRLALLSETEKFNEYISQLKAITPPTLNDEILAGKVREIVRVIG